MLIGKITKNKMGITLIGDFHDFESLNETIHEIIELFNPPETEKNYILALAYDARKAQEGQRIVFKNEKYKNYFGVNILWITYLFQIKYLRYAAGYIPTTKKIQSELYRIEYLTEKAIIDTDPVILHELDSWFKTSLMLPVNFLTNFVLHLDYKLYKISTNSGERFKKLPHVLSDLFLLSDEYTKYENEISAEARKKNVNPNNISYHYDFPQDDAW
jgi:hypothetical protein